ncbi:hypothetical protein A3E49_00610 [Candidatus Saccharibacteria bacterium RIFCSPHIGHO2_12_FULL_49_19]|nr:MAG: hypothetical protein A3E49_00610 [Candidatus Saccharibacteria bacterium RIFCSPHIGHO2_12_FULL_49_19]
MLNEMDDKLLTLTEVAQILRVTKLTVWRYTDSGLLPAYKIGRDLRIKQSDLELFIGSRRKQIKKR